MKKIARAKINPALYVLGKRPDGYHELELIFQPVSLADELDIEKTGGDTLAFSCSVPAFSGPDNLVCRGYARMKELFGGRVGGLRVHLTKKIPSGAGMAGGSTDCAAMLQAVNELFALGLSCGELAEIGACLGADVPACLIPHATLGRGIGEKLEDIHMHGGYPLLVLKPDITFPTGKMYALLDERGHMDPPGGTEEMVRAMEAGDLRRMCGNLYNVFEEAVPEPERIAECRRRLLQAGALGSRMTGSGSCVFGIFESPEKRDLAFLALRNLPGCTVYACEAVNEW